MIERTVYLVLGSVQRDPKGEVKGVGAVQAYMSPPSASGFVIKLNLTLDPGMLQPEIDVTLSGPTPVVTADVVDHLKEIERELR